MQHLLKMQQTGTEHRKHLLMKEKQRWGDGSYLHSVAGDGKAAGRGAEGTEAEAEPWSL